MFLCMHLILIEFTDSHHMLGILVGTIDIMVSSYPMMDTYQKRLQKCHERYDERSTYIRVLDFN